MDNHNKELSDNQNDNVEGAKEGGHIDVKEKENTSGTYHPEDDIGPSKASRVIKGVFIVAIVGGAALVTLGIKWHSKSTPAVATVEETTEVDTTEEDLNVKVDNENAGKSLEELLGDKEEVSAPVISNTGDSLEHLTEEQKSLTETQQPKQDANNTDKAGSNENESIRGEKAQESVESVPVEKVSQNMNKDEFNALQEKYESEAESMENNEELMNAIKENAKKLYGK